MAKEEWKNAIISGKQAEDKLVADCATLEAQEVSVFKSHVSNP